MPSIDPRFRGKLIALMTNRGISGAALAARTPMSRSYLSEIINGDKMPSQKIAQKLDEALDAKGELANLVGICALTDDLDPLAEAAANPHRIGRATIESFGRVLSAQRALEDTVGAGAVIGPVLPQMDTITAMVRNTSGPLRPDLVLQAGQWAQWLGWLYTSLGEWDQAQHWNRTALEWATEAGNTDLAATVLSYQAHVSWLTLCPGSTVGLAEAALRDPTVYPGQRAYDCFQSAKAHAYAGEIDDAKRMLAAGDEQVEAADGWGGDMPPWHYYRGLWSWQLERGIVWLYADRWEPGSATKSVGFLRSGLELMPEDMRECDWAAEYLVYLTAAYIRAGATQFAREVLADAKRIADATRSARVLRLVATRERQLAELV